VADEQTAARIVSEIARDLRMEQISRERGRGDDGLATPAQLRYLKRLNVQVAPGLKKKQASALIDAELAKGNNGDEDETVAPVSSQQNDDARFREYVPRIEDKGTAIPRRVP